ncbi:MAG TPA: hypothetical protein VIY72_15875 [Acidimicrobiales bacterium]
MDDPLVPASDDLLSALEDSIRFVREHPFYADPQQRPAAMAFLMSVLTARIEEDVVGDPEFPHFRIIDRRTREGGDNPDQRYLVTPVTGGGTYRIWGSLGSATRVELQVYAGIPYLGDGGGTASYLSFEDLEISEDGSFEVILSPGRIDGNWMDNPPESTKLFVRQIYDTWSADPPGEVHIDRVDAHGELRPDWTPDDMAERLHATATDLRSHVQVWPTIVQAIVERVPANQFGPPTDSRASGGVPGRWMINGHFDLADDEALIVTTRPMSGNYQGIQLLDLWMNSLEYADRQTSLSTGQADRSGDGCHRFVVCATDPGVANWLDTMGRRRGLVLVRYDGTTETTFDEEKRPTTEVVKRAELDDHLPADTRHVTGGERRQAIAERRHHLQVRFGV